MLRKSRRFLGMPVLSAIWIFGLDAALLRVVHAEASESRYTDLRHIEISVMPHATRYIFASSVNVDFRVRLRTSVYATAAGSLS